MTATAEDHRTAADVARLVGRRLVAERYRLRRDGATGAETRAAGDRLAHDLAVGLLARRAPGDAVLSEEGDHDPARLGADRVWVVDPLDGTIPFARPGRTDWAVHVALVEDGRPVAGAVALPARGRCYATGRRLARAPLTLPAWVVVSPHRPVPEAAPLAAALGGEVAVLGSAGVKMVEVLEGRAAAYVHSGGQYEWDSAAPVAVARAAGLHASRLDGSPLRYNRPDPYLPDLLICHPRLAGRILTVLSGLGRPAAGARRAA